LVAGIPGRIIYSHFDAESQSNSELQLDWQAQVIQNLFKRIKFLEKEIESLRSIPELSLTKPQTNSQTDSDRLIEEFLDGAGI
ncbi:MAG: serine O-acetyltransferase, partial [Xenococcaceae cyanobacterium]